MPENGKIPGGFYIKPRRFDESNLAHAAPCVREVWDWLIRNASFRDGHRKGHYLKRGQLVTSINEIREGLSWGRGFAKDTYSERQVKGAMKVLRETGRIAPANESTKVPGGVILTICKYNYYQDIRNYEGIHESTDESTYEDQAKVPRRSDEGPADSDKALNGEASRELHKEREGTQGKEYIYSAQSGRILPGEILESFNQFWEAFGFKKGKAEAADVWLDLWPEISADEDMFSQIIDSATREAENRHGLKERNGTPKMAAGWLTGRRWEDEQEQDDYAGPPRFSDDDLDRLNQ